MLALVLNIVVKPVFNFFTFSSDTEYVKRESVVYARLKQKRISS